MIDELLAVSDNPESAILGPHLPLLTHSQIKDLLFSLGGPPRLQVRIDRAIIDGYAHFKEYGRQYTRFPHPLQVVQFTLSF